MRPIEDETKIIFAANYLSQCAWVDFTRFILLHFGLFSLTD